MKTLPQLADDYLSSIKLIEDIAENTRKELAAAKKKCNVDEITRLGTKLAVLYEEIRDMRIISEKLRHYYDEESKYQEAV